VDEPAALDDARTRQWRRRARLALTSLLLPLSLAGCAAIIPQAPNAIFDLSAPGRPSPARGSIQILVPQPTAVKALDNDRIAARPTPAQYAYLPNAVWSDLLPRLLQTRLIDTLQNSGRVRAAAQPGQGLLINYQLLLNVRAFELQAEGAVAEFAVKLMDDTNGRVIRSRVVRHVVPVPSLDNASIVAGLDAAMDAAFLEIARWAAAGGGS
jgi:cholesterol transport system auxiliary component